MKPTTAPKLMLVAAMTLFSKCLCAGPPPDIRVLIVDGGPSITIEGQGSILRTTSSSGRERESAGARERLIAGEKGLVMRGADRGGGITFENKTRRYRIGERSFKGTIATVWKEKGGLLVINKLPLEDYLVGLINSEISSSWHAEAIKAQAVAARTYALYQIDAARRAITPRPYDITSTTLDQVYDGAHNEDVKSQRAVMSTRGEVLLRGGAIFSAYYHSCCAGLTEHAHNVWPGEQGPPVVKDRYCEGSPKLIWEWNIGMPEFVAAMDRSGVQIGLLQSIATTQLPDSPRADMVILEDGDGMKMIRATELRKIFGYQNIKSTWFDVAIRGNKIKFTGRGYGHGVGLCQWGAKGMAEEGIGYRDILKFYYPDANVATLY